MLQLQNTDDLLIWANSAVCQHHVSLCRVWHHLPEVKGSRFYLWSETHTLTLSRTLNNLQVCTGSHRSFVGAHGRAGVHISALRGATYTDMRARQMKEVNCLSLTSWVAAGGCECAVISREGKWICWLSVFVSDAISHLSFAACLEPCPHHILSLLELCSIPLCSPDLFQSYYLAFVILICARRKFKTIAVLITPVIKNKTSYLTTKNLKNQ